MGKAKKKRESWQERKKRMKHRWTVAFVYVEWICEQLSYLLERWAFLEILEYAGRLTVLVAVIFYIKGCPERQMQAEDQRKAKHYQAWQVINSAQGKTGSGGRIDALQDLNGDDVSLAGVDLSKANLRGVNLEHANLREANLSEAHFYEANLSMTYLHRANMTRTFLYETNLSGADLSEADLIRSDLSYADFTGAVLQKADFTRAILCQANLTGANLYCANIGEIVDWQSIKSVESANIYGLKGPPIGFEEWAQEHGAVSIEDKEEWEKLLQEKKNQNADSGMGN